MERHDFKLKKIRNLTDEVNQFHPLLKDLLPRLPAVSTVEYTHGQHEMGADFVVVIQDATLDSVEYVGLIVKIGDVRQNHDTIDRQIKECSVPRIIDGGKKKIHLNQIWVVTNGGISENAKIKINENYNNKNIKFIWDEQIITLVDKYLPEYWEDMDRNIGLYLSAVGRRVQDLNSRFGILEITQDDFYVEQDVVRIEFDSKKKFLSRKNTPQKLSSVLKKERFVLVEAGMGYGKSRLLRQAAIDFAVHSKFVEDGILPVFISFRDLVDIHSNSLSHLLNHLKNDERIDPAGHSLLFVVDGVDEIKGDSKSKAEIILEFVEQLMSHDKMQVVFASRPFEDPAVEQILDRCLCRYALQPLSMQRLVSFVEKVCAKSVVTSKLKSDLQKSDLFRSLPKTPISAILLGRVLNADVKELPSTLPELYSKYMDLALGRWDIKKGSISEKEYETTVILVRAIAKIMLESDIPEIGIGDAREIVKEYLSKRETGQNVDKLFENITNCSEVICIDEIKNKLFFRHRTFLEFMYSEDMFIKHGKSAKVEHPFDGYWGAVNYFYLGKLKDCPEQLKEIFALIPKDEPELISKIIQSGSYLLAAYQSPYEGITDCVKRVVLDAADLYCKTCKEPSGSPLGRFPEVQLLAVITGLMRHTFEYDFFEHALRDVETEVLLSTDSEKRKAVAAFFVAAIRAGLGNTTAFDVLISDHLSNLPLALKLGIKHASNDAKVTNDTIKRLEKKMNRLNKGSSLLIKTIYEVPLDERKGPVLV